MTSISLQMFATRAIVTSVRHPGYKASISKSIAIRPKDSRYARFASLSRKPTVMMAAKKAAPVVEEEEEEEEEEIEVEEEVIETEEVPVTPLTTVVIHQAPSLLQRPAVKNSLIAVGGVLAVTFLLSAYKVIKKYMSPRGKRKRTVNKNKYLVETVDELLKTDTLTRESMQKMKRDTGFSLDLCFRKYLRYLMDQRQFDPKAVADVLHLRQQCMLTDAQVVEVLTESAQRTFERSGILMVKPKGLTAAGLQKKAAGRATFAKLMYLADQPELLAENVGKDLQMAMKEIFGATEDDAAEVAITSLSEADVNALESLMGRGDGQPAQPEAETEVEAAATEEGEQAKDETEEKKEEGSEGGSNDSPKA